MVDAAAMGFGKIADVNEIPDAGTVRRRIIGSENPEFRTRLRGQDRQRDQVRFGCVPLPKTAVRIRAEFENPAPYDLKPGLKVQMTIFLTTDRAAVDSQATGTRTARAQ